MNASATRLPAVSAVARKSKGEVRNGGHSVDAYAAPEKIGASDQSANDAVRKSTRPATMATAASSVLHA
jgi:hypothetical protein